MKTRISTLGHSTRSLEEFVETLRTYDVRLIVDVRTVPRSRHNPQFNQETLREALASSLIGYSHVPGLGGLRRPQENSPNTGWRNESFRGFADHMLTDAFEVSLLELIALAKERHTALLCAEAVPWRCHRSLIADALVVRGMEVQHILDKKHVRAHSLTPFARVEGTRLVYPGDS